jgi:hypothetical protein
MILKMKIANKWQMLTLLLNGRLGNTTRIWQTQNDLRRSGFEGLVAVRYKIPCNAFQEGIPAAFIPGRIKKLIDQGLDEKLMYFHEWTPAKSLVLNCHLERSERYAELTYSENKNIKINAKNQFGLKAINIIKSVVGVEGWEKLCDLHRKFPESVIEFTCHNRLVVQASNLVIWEVRNY